MFPTIERLHELFYIREDGVLIRKTGGKGFFAGSVAGCPNSKGYINVHVDRVSCKAHRLVWAMHTGKYPDGVIDHINGIRHDNRPENLRDTTIQGNAQNRTRLQSNNKSGFHGVSWNKTAKAWTAQAKNPKTMISVNLGVFSDPEKAAIAVDNYRMKNYRGYIKENADLISGAKNVCKPIDNGHSFARI